MKYNPYKRCSCKACKHWPPSNIKGQYKRAAHREFRRESKRKLRDMDDSMVLVSIPFIA